MTERAPDPAKDHRKRVIDAARAVRKSPAPALAGNGGFRVVVTGKGGVGKTSVTALLARMLAAADHSVLALDADPQMNLPFALGLPFDQARALVPLSHNVEYVEEKTGARPGSGWGLFFRLNPDVADVVERFGVVGPEGVRLLVMGTLTQPAAGCLCPENSLLAAVVNAMSLRKGDVQLMDTQAGVEHFGRALARGFQQAVILVDPTFNALQVGLSTARLALDLGIPALHLVVNRVRRPDEMERTMRRLEEEGGFPFTSVHALPFDEGVLETEPAVSPLLQDLSTPFMSAMAGLRDALVTCDEEAVRCAS